VGVIDALAPCVGYSDCSTFRESGFLSPAIPCNVDLIVPRQ
jgi:hypothetical protein